MSTLFVDEIAGIASADTVAIPGHVIQVVSDTLEGETIFTSYSIVSTGLSLAITPSSTANKVLIMCDLSFGKLSQNIYANMYIYKNGSLLKQIENSVMFTDTTQNFYTRLPIKYLDSPATTSSTTYSIHFEIEGSASGSMRVNPDGNAVSTITLMEIAG